MRKAKKLIALFLCIAMFVSAFAGCGKAKNAQETVAAATEESITCGEWYDLLASNFGAVNSETEKPYFSNITKENDMFAKIQTLVEFGVIDREKELNLDDYVTYKEMALNALTLLGTDIVGDYLKNDKDLKEDDLLQFAKDKKIVSKTDNNYATKEDAQTAVDTTVNLYVNKPITDKQDTKLKSSVKDIRKNDVLYENGNVTINDETKLKAGDIIILPASDEYPMGLARKVTAVNGNVLTTTEPELDEVYEKIDISATVIPKISEITPLESGVSIEEYSDIEGLNANTEPKIISLSNNSEITPLAKESKGLSFSIPINITKNKLLIDTKWTGLTLEMSKQNTKLDKNNIPFAYDKNGNQYTQKYTGGLEIKGKITIENLKFDVDVDWSAKDVIKSVSISPKFTTKVDLSIKGKAEGEELSVFKTSVPIGSTGVWVDCIFVVKVEINGDITIKTKMMSESCVSYKKGKGVTTVSNKNDFDNKAQISGNLTVGVGPKTVITVLGIDIADATLVLGLGAKGTLKATVGSTELPCMDIKAYGPTATFSLGKDKTTLLNKLGVTVKVKLIDLEDALLKPIWTTTYHWESNNGWMKSSECTGNKKNEESSATTSSPSNSSSNNDEMVSSNSENQTVSSDTNLDNTTNKLPLTVNWITTPKYTFDDIESTLDGKAWIGITYDSNHNFVNKKLIDENGNQLYEADNMEQSSTYTDIIIVRKGSQYGMITTNGKVLIALQQCQIGFLRDNEKTIIVKMDAEINFLGHILDKNGNDTGETVHSSMSGAGSSYQTILDCYLYDKSTNLFYEVSEVGYDVYGNKSYTAFFGYHFNQKNDAIIDLPKIFTAHIADCIGSEIEMGEFELKGYKGCGVFVNKELKSNVFYDSIEISVENTDWNKTLFSGGKRNNSEEINQCFIINAFGEKILNETFENVGVVKNQNSIPVKQNGKWGFINIPVL